MSDTEDVITKVTKPVLEANAWAYKTSCIPLDWTEVRGDLNLQKLDLVIASDVIFNKDHLA